MSLLVQIIGNDIQSDSWIRSSDQLIPNKRYFPKYSWDLFIFSPYDINHHRLSRKFLYILLICVLIDHLIDPRFA